MRYVNRLPQQADYLGKMQPYLYEEGCFDEGRKGVVDCRLDAVSGTAAIQYIVLKNSRKIQPHEIIAGSYRR